MPQEKIVLFVYLIIAAAVSMFLMIAYGSMGIFLTVVGFVAFLLFKKWKGLIEDIKFTIPKRVYFFLYLVIDFRCPLYLVLLCSAIISLLLSNVVMSIARNFRSNFLGIQSLAIFVSNYFFEIILFPMGIYLLAHAAVNLYRKYCGPISLIPDKSYNSPTPKADAQWDENPEMPPAGIRLGQKNGSVYRYNGKTHLMTFSQTRGGKGTTSIIPNLLEYDGPVFVIDPKGENVLNTIGYRKGVLGRNVVVLDPFNESGLPSDCFNPMDFIDKDSINDDCGQIAEALITTKSKDPFWDNCAKSLLTASIYYVYQAKDNPEKDNLEKDNPEKDNPETEKPDIKKNLVEVYDRTLIDRDDFFIKMGEQKNLHHSIRHAIADVLKGAENTKAGIFTTLRENLSELLNEDKIRNNLLRSTFSINDFLEGNTDIFLILPLDRLKRYRKWFRLILATVMKNLLRKTTVADSRKKLFILDEFGNLGHLEVLENAFTTIAGRNVLLWPFIQSFQQLENDYPNAWRTILSQAGVKEIFNLGDDNVAAEYVSKVIGKTTVFEKSYSSGASKNKDDAFFGSGKSSTGSNEGETTTEKEVPLLPPEKLLRFDEDKKIILRQGKNPVWIYKTPYYQDPELRSKWKNSLQWVTEKYPHTDEIISNLLQN